MGLSVLVMDFVFLLSMPVEQGIDAQTCSMQVMD